MPEEGPRGGCLISAPGRSHWWPGAHCLPRERFGLARVVCVVGLFALLVSAISPADDSVQPDFSRYFRTGERIVRASRLSPASHLFTRNCTTAPTALGIEASPVFHSADHAVPGLHARISSPGLEHSHAGRAPPALVFSA